MDAEHTQAQDGRPAYGVVDHYLGERGRRYFEPQKDIGIAAGVWNRFLFDPYVTSQDEVLDFGCGGGYLLSALRPRVAVGVEVNPVAREMATSLGIETHATLEEVKGRTFSRIITSHALEHVPCPLQILRELRALLGPGGRLVWVSPMDDWRAGAQRSWRRDDPDMHIHTWTPLSMGNVLAAAGFDVISVSVVAHAWPPAPIREGLWRLSPRAFHFGARLWAVLRRRRQLLGIAARRAEGAGRPLETQSAR